MLQYIGRSVALIAAIVMTVGVIEGHLLIASLFKWWGAGMIICLWRGAHLHMAQLMPLPLTISCSSKYRYGFIFLVPAHPGSPG